MNTEKILKATLITLGGVSAAMSGDDWFPAAWRAWARLAAAGTGVLLAYLLKPVASEALPLTTDAKGDPALATKESP